MAVNYQPTTYKQVCELFQDICLRQESVKQFHVGMLSDLDVENDVHPFQRFPVIHMVPDISTMDRFGKLTLGFDMICADIARDNEQPFQTNTHNNTMMILQDIFSKIIMTDWSTVGIEIETPIVLQPFQESYNNNLAGWTATLNVIVKSPFNLCDAAFA